jgi:putative flippase GtrA
MVKYPSFYEACISKLIAKIHRSRFTRTVIVGGTATALDLLLLVVLVRDEMLTPEQANLPSLFAGSAVQFLGNRYWVFQAQDRPWGRQLVGFFVAEAISFGLNWLGFDLLVKHTSIYYPLARPASVAIVFFGFSYPVWKWIFRSKQNAPAPLNPPANPLHRTAP